MPLDRAALREQVMAARAMMRSQGGQATLRFSIINEMTACCTNSSAVMNALLALWNAAPELLADDAS